MRICESADDLVEAMNSLYEDFETLKKMSDAGEKFIENYFTLETAKKVMEMDLINRDSEVS